MITTILLIVSFISFTLYTKYIRRNYGIQESISASYYELDGWRKNYFTLALWGAAFPLVFIAAYPTLNILMVLAGSLICLTAVSPHFRRPGLENVTHMVGAFGGYSLAILSLIFEYDGLNYMIVSGAVFVSIIFNSHIPGNYKIDNDTWIAEEIGYYIILFGLFISNL